MSDMTRETHLAHIIAYERRRRTRNRRGSTAACIVGKICRASIFADYDGFTYLVFLCSE